MGSAASWARASSARMRPPTSPSLAAQSSTSSQSAGILRAVGEGFEEQLLGAGDVLLVRLEVGGALPEGAGPLLGRGGGAAERVEQLAQVLDRLAAREDAHQRLERLAELRVRVERGEIIAGGHRLFAAGLLEHAALVEQQRLRALVLLGRELGAEPRDEGHRAFCRRSGGLDCHVVRRASEGDFLVMPDGRVSKGSARRPDRRSVPFRSACRGLERAYPFSARRVAWLQALPSKSSSF